MPSEIHYFAKSDVGLRRFCNEDHYLIVDPPDADTCRKRSGIAFLIADGIGGHAAGEIASRMACEEVAAAYYDKTVVKEGPGTGDGSPVRKLEGAIRTAHDGIVARAATNPELRGMGTTLSALVLAEGKALIGHVGDSRIYRFRKNRCERMTIDHTKRQAMIDTGRILPEDRQSLRYGHILTQALGGYGDLTEVATRVEDLQSGDLFLLCTDGLHGLLSDPEIERILARGVLPQTACDELVQSALERGGDDNVTVIVIQA